MKIRTATTEALQAVLRRIFEIPGVSGTQTIVVLETCFERPLATVTSALPGPSSPMTELARGR